MKMNFINFNFVTLNELNFGEFINKERDAENFILQNNLVNLVPHQVFKNFVSDIVKVAVKLD
jgi:hypothetical protein